MSWLKKIDANIIVNDSVIQSKKLGISLYIPEVDESDVALLESVYVCKMIDHT
jgi:hypothetical protein